MAIRIKGLNKVFRLDKQKTPFEALKNIDLEIEKGKVTGIIGPNGAGKSTLLKILSGITYPDSGTAEIDGTISSLLEVGTGFHPELTGKENIFLNGSILGMKRGEIQDKFDDIVEFSGVQKFINTPVKHYSSGMYVRLAFSVAAHLNSDILLIDEVLAVGDAEFQKKCLDRMDQVSHSDNRTIVFVSHNMNAARNLCDEIIYLDEGIVKMKGKPEDVIRHYLSSLQESSNSQSLAERTDRKGNGEVRFTGLQFIDPNNADAEVVLSTGGKATLKVDYTSDSKTEFINYLSIRISVYNNFGNYLTTLSNELTETISKAPSSGSLYCHLDRLPFMPGRYYVKANIYQGQVHTDGVDHALTFDVQEGDFYQSGNTYSRKVPGIFVDQEWERSSGK